MLNKVIDLLDDNFSLSSKDKIIMRKNTRELSREERHYYFQQLKPREGKFKDYLKDYLKEAIHNGHRQEMKEMVIDSLLDRRGDPSIAGGLLMDVLGRLEIYKELREKAAARGVKLRALTNFGGIGMAITIVGLLTALILYITGR